MTVSGKPKILIADDEEKNLKVMGYILQKYGYDYDTAANGREALKKAGKYSPDIILLDVMMPEMDGYEVCRRIKESEALRNIPVVMITSLSSKEDRIKGIEAGAEEFLSKPFDQAEVLARIKMLLKVKALNDKLSSAYKKITNLTVFGENLAKTFTPADFELMSKVDAIVSQIIRKKSDEYHSPQIVLVRLLSGSGYKWYRYEFMFDSLDKGIIDVGLTFKLPPGEDSMMFFGDEPAIERRYGAFERELAGHNISLSNMVCYLSETLCIFALNYGYDVSEYDSAVLNSLVLQTLFLKSLSTQINETEDAFAYTVYALARAAEANDEDTGNHILRVGEYSAIIAKELGLPDKFIEKIKLHAPLHDVGKVHIHPDLLRKPAKLTDEEWKDMRQHPVYGAKIIGDHPGFSIARNIALTHHERWDGSGYPRGIKGTHIPIEGRIITMADVYDALRNARVYKPPIDHAATCTTIINGDGRTMPHHFDPQVLKAFRNTMSRFEETYERLKG